MRRWLRLVLGVTMVASTWVTSGTGPATAADDPGAAAAEEWAEAAHRDLLGRPATTEEVAEVRDRILAGTTRGTIAAELATSDEWVGRVVTQLYQHVLGRDPDTAGRAYWVGRIQAGDRVASVAVSLYGSAEYWARTGATPDGFVRALYRDILVRAPEPDGLAYWVGRLEAGTRPWVVGRAFFLSAEARGRRVTDLYDDLLRRRAATDERAYWVGRLVSIDDIGLAAFLVGSDEYLALVLDPPPPIGAAHEVLPARRYNLLTDAVVGLSGDGDTVAVQRADGDYDTVIEAVELPDGTVEELGSARPFAGAVLFTWTLTRPALTDQGRLVALGDGGPRLFDRNAGTATDLGPGSSWEPELPATISGDGTTVAYVRQAAVPAPGSGTVLQVQARPRSTATPTWTSTGDGHSTDPRLSRDGRWLVFTSEATDLVEGDDNGQADVFLHDLEGGTTQRLTDGNAASTEPWISADGSTVAFTSTATDLVAGDEGDDGPAADVYVWDAVDGIVRVSDGAAAADGPSLSGDGRLVAFRQAQAGEGVQPRHPVLFDRATATGTPLVSEAGTVFQLQISADGTRLVATTHAGDYQYALWAWDLAVDG